MPHNNQNRLRQIRETLLIGKTELARKAGVSPVTIDRIEKGFSCRPDTHDHLGYSYGKLVGSSAALEAALEIPTSTGKLLLSEKVEVSVSDPGVPALKALRLE